MTQELALKYRPKSFEHVLGQEGVVASLQRVLEKGTNRAFIFEGPSGVGKTTIARILASTVGCAPDNILEVNAATYTGIDAMRDVAKDLVYRALGDSATKVVIIDEAHALSKQAWQSLLKPVEEPPKHVYWCFATTESSKIPANIRTRCASYRLEPVNRDLLLKLVGRINRKEELGISDDVLDLVVERSWGSPRLAINGLAMVQGCESKKDAARLLQHADAAGEVIDLCRYLVKGERGMNWVDLMRLVTPLKATNPESIRIPIVNYFNAVALGSDGGNFTAWCLQVIDAFAEPYPQASTIYPVLLSLGKLVFNEE